MKEIQNEHIKFIKKIAQDVDFMETMLRDYRVLLLLLGDGNVIPNVYGNAFANFMNDVGIKYKEFKTKKL